ncbi:uncharacterized protein LOC117573172 [Drosophila albomicans]|uniref:Uncharacterized protein LOC117573172 n=1 Tax=Drosophila albomicans TaxID=7291 RepID=A0A6P8X749_DROAB|nr:uncharacterized protein LOC117573172 [Drosophila albomicans]
MKKDYDLRICTWNVRTLNWEGASIQLADALEKLKADITAIQEMRWTGQGCSKRANCDIYYSCHAERREFGCGFVVSRRLRHHVSNFTPVGERLATIRDKARFFNLSIICAHAPTEEKDDAVKDALYGMHASSVMDVRTFRGVNIDSDHYLIAAKIRMRLCRAKNVRPITQRKLDVTRLRSQRTATAYSTHFSELLHQPTPLPVDAGGLWAHISHSMRAAAEITIGFKRPPTRNQWYDEECRVAAAAKNAAYRKTLQSGATRATCDRYRENRKEERRLFKWKKWE